ncbi:MAG: NAD-dependent protein deacylase [Oscillospiraceae bacterium]|nr:NAD-dependent protein deacylase [Oscillospiraceae bacterium]
MTLQNLIDEAQRIVLFGGAGLSTESGIPDYRSVDGLYHQKFSDPPETILSHTYFMQKPQEFYAFYKEKMVHWGAKPNPAHLKLAELERAGKSVEIVTQNVDGLHQAAGSGTVWELHGSIYRNYCMKCHKHYTVESVMASDGVPVCDCGGIVRPDVVLYEEGLEDRVISGAIHAIETADLLIVAGTSLAVYPAAGLLTYRRKSTKLALINREPTAADSDADLVIHGNVGEVLSEVTV